MTSLQPTIAQNKYNFQEKESLVHCSTIRNIVQIKRLMLKTNFVTATNFALFCKRHEVELLFETGDLQRSPV